MRKNLDRIYQALASIRTNDSGCKIWSSDDKRPRVKLDGKWYSVARLALEQNLGRPIQHGFILRHSCSNNLCVNPEHLYEYRAPKPTKKGWTHQDRVEQVRRISQAWNSSPEGKAHLQQIQRIANNPERLKKLHDKWARSPENRARMQQLGKTRGREWARSPENRARMQQLGKTKGREVLQAYRSRRALANVEEVLQKWATNPTDDVLFEPKLLDKMKRVPREQLVALFNKFGVVPPPEE